MRKPLRSKEKKIKPIYNQPHATDWEKKSHLETLQTLIIVKSLNSPWFMDVFLKKSAS